MKCIVVDDEPFALELIKGYIEKTPFLELAGAFSNPLKAMQFLMANQAELVFLDINMPEISGLGMLNSLRTKPLVIFITAYPEYGAESYNYDAVDYLLKPVKYERFLKAVNKAYDAAGKSKPEKVVTDTNRDDESALLLKSGSQVYRVLPKNILFVEGTGNYMAFYTTGKKILSLLTMKEAIAHLPADQFVRVHKSYIISLAHIDVIERHQVIIQGHRIPIGITYREQFFAKYRMPGK